MNYFFVFQNKTYGTERKGQYLWAPCGNFFHWQNMTKIHKGDIIFHSYKKKILSISVATSECFPCKRPFVGEEAEYWEEDGWKVTCKYFDINNPIITSDYIDDILRLQPSKYAPFNKSGRGNVGYLFQINKQLTDFIIGKLESLNKEIISEIKEFIRE